MKGLTTLPISLKLVFLTAYVVSITLTVLLFLLAKEMGTMFCFGAMFGMMLYHLAHRAKYGYWFDGS